MSFNIENNGTPIAIVKNNDPKKHKKTDTEIFLTDKNLDDDVKYPMDKFDLKKNEKFQPIPNYNTERQILYLTGASGSGKSYYAKNYIKEFQKIFPKREIFLMSSLRDDKSLDDIKGLNRINIWADEFLDDDITAEDFKDSLLICDDTDCLTNKDIKDKVNSILDSVLQTGRHWNCYVIYTSHLPCKGKDTQMILNECHSITFYPNGLGGRSLKYLLESYLGLDKKQIEAIKNMDSRWVTVLKSYPQVVISEKDLKLVKDL